MKCETCQGIGFKMIDKLEIDNQRDSTIFLSKNKDAQSIPITFYQQDLELKKELEKIEWKKYLEYGSIRIQVRQGKKTLVAFERTYPD